MVISRTPFRISFFGGGTDYPLWYREAGGEVLATTIDKYAYLSCRYLPPFFDHKYRIVYSKIENVMRVDEIEHPAVRAVVDRLRIPEGLEIHYDGDLPARSGIGSSSSFTVGLLHALLALQSREISKEELASTAIHIEQEVMRECVGSQDQICAAHGGFNHIRFRSDGGFQVSPLALPAARLGELERCLMLYFTGISRIASVIARSKMENFGSHAAELRVMSDMVPEAISILGAPRVPLEEFGKLLHETWLCKRSLSRSVSTPRIDEIYGVARQAGATGGKLLGAGGGGFLLLFVKPEAQSRVTQAMRCFTRVPFQFESTGSTVIFHHAMSTP